MPLWDINRNSSGPAEKFGITLIKQYILTEPGGGRVVRRCWMNFQCRGVLLIWIIVEQGPSYGGGGGCLDIFSLVFFPPQEDGPIKMDG